LPRLRRTDPAWRERAGVDEDGEQATYCYGCHESEKESGVVKEL
jgi:hypothetical protein